MLRYRLIFGSLLITLLVGVFWLDSRVGEVSVAGTAVARRLGRDTLPGGLVMSGMFTALAVLASRELAAMVRAKGVTISVPILAMGVISICVVAYLAPTDIVTGRGVPMLATLAAIVVLAAFIQHSVPGKQTQGAIAAGGATALGLIYLGVLPAFYLLIRHDHAAWVVAGSIFVVKQCDTGAYFTGRLIGRRKLIPWLSPGKTWEGLAGGLVLSAVTAALLAMWANHLQLFRAHVPGAAHTIPVWYAAIAGAVVGGVGHIGDLLESLLKRDAGMKDSGRLIPGMGGALDVLDSPLIAAPVIYWMLQAAPAA